MPNSCLECRFAACTAGDAGWNGEEMCLNHESPRFGKVATGGCDFYRPINWEVDKDGNPSYLMPCIPDKWVKP